MMKQEQIPERPAEAKPGPPEAPKMVKAAMQASGNLMTSSNTNQWQTQTMPERKEAPASVSNAGTVAQSPLEEMWTLEGGRLIGFGYLRSYSYREVWSWICDGTVTMQGLARENNWMNKALIDFLSWMQKLQQLMDEAKAV